MFYYYYPNLLKDQLLNAPQRHMTGMWFILCCYILHVSWYHFYQKCMNVMSVDYNSVDTLNSSEKLNLGKSWAQVKL